MVDGLNSNGVVGARSQCRCQIPASVLLNSQSSLQIILRLRGLASGFQYIRHRRETILEALLGRLLDSDEAPACLEEPA